MNTSNNITFSNGSFKELERLTELIYWVYVDDSTLLEQNKVTFHYGNILDIHQTVKLISTISSIKYLDKTKKLFNYAGSLNTPIKPAEVCININFSGHKVIHWNALLSKYAQKEDVLKKDKTIGAYAQEIL